MKRKQVQITDLEARFNDVKLERKKLNYLTGGDGGGSQGGVDDPWKPIG